MKVVETTTQDKTFSVTLSLSELKGLELEIDKLSETYSGKLHVAFPAIYTLVEGILNK